MLTCSDSRTADDEQLDDIRGNTVSTFRERLLQMAEEHEHLHRVHKQLHVEHLAVLEQLAATDFQMANEDTIHLEDTPLFPAPISTGAPPLPPFFLRSSAELCNPSKASKDEEVLPFMSEDTRRSQCNHDDMCAQPTQETIIGASTDSRLKFGMIELTNGQEQKDPSERLGCPTAFLGAWSRPVGEESMDPLEPFFPGLATSSPQHQQAFEIATIAGLAECYDTKRDYGVLSPFSIIRVSWDVVLFFCILFELWVTPFDLLFLDAQVMPETIRHVSHVITCIFILDIGLSFNTGYVYKGEIHMTRRLIARKYLHFWFWLDLVSSMPVDLIFSLMGGGFLRGVKIGKALRIFRTVRYVKMLRSVTTSAYMSDMAVARAQVWSICGNMLRPFGLVGLVLVIGHGHACLLAAFQPHSALSLNIVDAIGEYYRSFWQAWIILFMGFAQPPIDTEFDWTIFFYVFVSLERICALALGAVSAVVYARVNLSDYMKLASMKDNAIKYLRSHGTSLETQLQLRFSLEEMAKARFRQEHFEELTSSRHMAAELHRRISCELWGSRLMAFGLISQVAHMNDDFILELSLRVREEVFASKMVLFHYGDAAIAAYHIISGRLESVTVPGVLDSKIQYEPGHWLGESALVNPLLRRALSVITKDMCYLMVVPATDFQDVISHFRLTGKFQKFIREHLWKGLCSRCGVLGDHFSNECPGLRAHRYTKSDTRPGKSAHRLTKFRRSVGDRMSEAFHSISKASVTSRGLDIGSDLLKFLTEMQLVKLSPWLQDLHIVTLDDLQNLDLSVLANALGDELQLDEREWAALTTESIEGFLQSAAEAAHRMFQSGIATNGYYVFLSHSKLDSGTEAALMRTELEQLIRSDPDSTLNDFDVPVFLDSEDLQSLTDLQMAIDMTHNLVLLLSPSVILRGWVLVEIVTAVKLGIRIVPVHVSKPGAQFEFPTEEFYESLTSGKLLDPHDRNILEGARVSLQDAEVALQQVFREIAVPYSPHKSSSMRKAELESLLKRCRLKRGHRSTLRGERRSWTSRVSRSSVGSAVSTLSALVSRNFASSISAKGVS